MAAVAAAAATTAGITFVALDTTDPTVIAVAPRASGASIRSDARTGSSHKRAREDNHRSAARATACSCGRGARGCTQCASTGSIAATARPRRSAGTIK